jgi:DNA-binding NarL/FixJ family response regulator
MDLALPNVSGVDATKQIKSARPEAKVLILSAHREQRYVEQALAAGASGYVLKQTPGADLVHAVRAVASGATYLDPQVAPYVLPNARAQLSQREIEVMRMIALGHSMKEMSTALEVSPRTLETYRMRAMEKLGLKTRADIVRFALQSGWLATD